MTNSVLEAGIRNRRPPAEPEAANLCWPPQPASATRESNPTGGGARLCRCSQAPTSAHNDAKTSSDTPLVTAAQGLPLHYQHLDERMGLEFQVRRLPFEGLQALDPRLIRIPPGACNEKHRHAHESIFVVLEGEAEILVGSSTVRLSRGGIAYAPRWLVHQSRNPSAQHDLLLLAVTDFGLTSAVLGDYDRQTRLRWGGADAVAEGPIAATPPPLHNQAWLRPPG
ncbi:MAG: cupin domain-containing protein [Synechococcaceae cyanobacterium]